LNSREWENFDLEPFESEEFDSWIRHKIESIGLESGEDIALLSPEDFSLPSLDEWTLGILDKTYPDTVTAGQETFLVHYELARKTVRLEKIIGQRKELPSLQYLPRFKGFAIEVEDRGKIRRLRERR
jgi:ATP-dependent helicase HrpB